jgi:GNAT superfamily N-acetyltransferase
MSDRSIRTLRPGEERKGQSLSRRVWSHEASRDLGRDIVYPARSVRIFRAYLADSSIVPLAAFSGRKLVGQCFGHLWGDQGWIGPIEVDHRHRAQGIASELLSRTEEKLMALGANVLGLEAAADRSDILAFYEKRGYREVGRTMFYQKHLKPKRGPLPGSGPMPAAELQADCHVDCSAEMRMTKEYRLGLLLGDGVNGSAAVYLHPLRGVPISALRVLLCRNADDMRLLLTDAEVAAKAGGSDTLFFNARADERTHEVITSLGYAAKGVNVTMLKKGTYQPPGVYCIAPWAG